MANELLHMSYELFTSCCMEYSQKAHMYKGMCDNPESWKSQKKTFKDIDEHIEKLNEISRLYKDLIKKTV